MFFPVLHFKMSLSMPKQQHAEQTIKEKIEQSRQSVVAMIQSSPNDLQPGRKLFFSPCLPVTHQMTFTMVMKQVCSTSLFLTCNVYSVISLHP